MTIPPLREFTLQPIRDEGEVRAFLLELSRQGPDDDRALWVWDPRLHNYRNTRDGRIIGQARMVELRDEFIAHEKAVAQNLVKQVFDGKMDLPIFEQRMREIIRRTASIEYMLAKGGRRQMTPRDWGAIGAMTKGQYRYLSGFISDLAGGRYTLAQMFLAANRAGMYVDAGKAAFGRGQTESYGMPRLDQYPGDGQTECLTRCLCHLKILEFPDRWEVIWVLREGAKHCRDCPDMAFRWNPLIIPKPLQIQPTTMEVV